MFALFAALAVFATVVTARPAVPRARQARRPHQGGGARARADPRPRARPPRHRRQARQACATSRKAYMRQIVERFNLQKALADEKTVNRLRMAGFRGQAPLVVFLFARAGRCRSSSSSSRCSICSRSSTSTSRPSIKILIAVVIRLYRLLSRRTSTSRNIVSEAPDIDPPRLAGCARPAPDLRRVGHVGRGRLPQGLRGDRRPVGRARRGADADHRRALLSAGAPPGLREPRHAHRPRGRQGR